MKRGLSVTALPFAVVLAVALVHPVRLHAQSTWRVPGQFATIDEAVRNAAPRDTILLTSSHYVPAGKGLVIDKGLVLEPEPGKRATITYLLDHDHAIRCTSVSGGSLVLRNLDIVPGPSQLSDFRSRKPLEISLPSSERGEVILDSVRTQGFVANAHAASPGFVASAGAEVRVMLRNCVFRGASGDVAWLAQGETGWDGSPGGILNLQGLTLAETTDFEAGPGGDCWGIRFSLPKARNGGAGIVGRATALTNCLVKDGNGGNVYVGSYEGDPSGKQGSPGASVILGDPFDVRQQTAREGWISTLPRPADPPLLVHGAGRKNVALFSQQVVGTPFPVLGRSIPPALGHMFLVLGASLARQPVTDPAGTLYVQGVLWFVPMSPLLEDVWYHAIPVDAASPPLTTLFVQVFTYRFDTVAWELGCPGSFTVFER